MILLSNQFNIKATPVSDGFDHWIDIVRACPSRDKCQVEMEFPIRSDSRQSLLTQGHMKGRSLASLVLWSHCVLIVHQVSNLSIIEDTLFKCSIMAEYYHSRGDDYFTKNVRCSLSLHIQWHQLRSTSSKYLFSFTICPFRLFPPPIRNTNNFQHQQSTTFWKVCNTTENYKPCLL